jgi:carbonic anhydrase/acetyltransferase-like protein (isoleucine patch superfamily)
MNLEDRLSYFASTKPTVAADAYIASNATLVGDVLVSDQSSVWFQCVLRADLNHIRIGRRSNIQDCAVVHVSDDFPTVIGELVTVGHGAILHACSIGDEVLIGMNAVILDGAKIGERSIIGANALVTAGTEVPPGSLFLGSPGKVVRTLSEQEQEGIADWAKRYVKLTGAYLAGLPALYPATAFHPLMRQD